MKLADGGRRTADGGRGGSDDEPSSSSNELSEPSNVLSDGSGNGGGFSSRPYYYEYIGESYAWTIDNSVTQATIDNINNRIQLTNEEREHYQLIDSLSQFGSNGLTADDIKLIQSGIITENNEDITASGFAGIFQRFYTSITGTPQNIILDIPFTNNDITIDPTFFETKLNNLSPMLLTLIHSFWTFLVSLYIVKDIQKLIEKIKNGSVAESSDTNIKANLL